MGLPDATPVIFACRSKNAAPMSQSEPVGENMREICQKTLPVKPWMAEKTRRLPGLNPVAAGDWLRVDDAYGAQMAYREALLAEKRDAVYRIMEPAEPAAAELLMRVLDEIGAVEGYVRMRDHVICPDGRKVLLDHDQPLLTAARLVQEDLVLMEETEGEHILTGAVLCFPASWSLAEKFGRNLFDIHVPVAPYTDDVGKRVQRLFDFIKPELPMWRANFLIYSDPDLHQPRHMENRRSIDETAPKWVRVERQCLLKLPITGAVVFSIHSYVVPIGTLSSEELDELMHWHNPGHRAV
jgi:heme-dependent oxidative N-demethylase alpha subunit-like protein